MSDFYQIANEIVGGALHSTSIAEFIEDCGGIEEAADRIVLWYEDEEGRDAEFTDVYDEPLDKSSPLFRRYVLAGLQ